MRGERVEEGDGRLPAGSSHFLSQGMQKPNRHEASGDKGQAENVGALHLDPARRKATAPLPCPSIPSIASGMKLAGMDSGTRSTQGLWQRDARPRRSYPGCRRVLCWHRSRREQKGSWEVGQKGKTTPWLGSRGPSPTPPGASQPGWPWPDPRPRTRLLGPAAKKLLGKYKTKTNQTKKNPTKQKQTLFTKHHVGVYTEDPAGLILPSPFTGALRPAQNPGAQGAPQGDSPTHLDPKSHCLDPKTRCSGGRKAGHGTVAPFSPSHPLPAAHPLQPA